MVTGMPLDTLISKYEVVLTMLKETCTQLTDADLDNIVTFGHEMKRKPPYAGDYGIWPTITVITKPILINLESGTLSKGETWIMNKRIRSILVFSLSLLSPLFR